MYISGCIGEGNSLVAERLRLADRNDQGPVFSYLAVSHPEPGETDR